MKIEKVIEHLTMWRNTISDKKRIEALNTALGIINQAEPRDPRIELPAGNDWILIGNKYGCIQQVMYIDGEFWDMARQANDVGEYAWVPWCKVEIEDIECWWEQPRWIEVKDDG